MGEVIGVMIPDSINPVHAENASNIERVALRAGFEVRVVNALGKRVGEEQCLDELLSAGVSGICTMSVSTGAHALYENSPVPVVLIGSRTVVPSLDYVVLDDYHAAYLVVEKLVRCKKTRIAFLSYKRAQGYSAIDRANGFYKAVHRNGDPSLTIVVEDLPSEELRASFFATKKLMELPEPPTAIVAQNDFIAYGALQALDELDLQPGRDVAVIGFDNLLYSQLPKMPLSTVSVMGRTLPERAFDLLLRRLHTPGPHGRCGIVLAPRLIYRNSFTGVEPC